MSIGGVKVGKSGRGEVPGMSRANAGHPPKQPGSRYRKGSRARRLYRFTTEKRASVNSYLLSRLISRGRGGGGTHTAACPFPPNRLRRPSPRGKITRATEPQPAVVMKTYEIYSIWPDAITPHTSRGPTSHPPSFSPFDRLFAPSFCV